MTTEAGEGALEEIERTRERLRGGARHAVGVTGQSEGDEPTLRAAITKSGVGWYPLGALSLLITVDQLQSSAISVLGPEITGALGISRSVLASANLLRTLAVTLAVLPIAASVQRTPRRAAIAIATAFVWSVSTIFTGFVVSVWGLVFVMVAAGVANGAGHAVHRPLLVDSYPPEVRVRALTFYRAVDGAGNIVGPLLIALLTSVIVVTWRGVFLGLGVLSLAITFVSVRLRDPGFGRWDVEKVREMVRRETGSAAGPERTGDDVSLGFFEIMRRLMLIPTIRRVLAADAVLGMLLIPFSTYLAFFLQDRWGMGPGARAVFSAAMPGFSLVSLALFGRRAESLYRRDPARLVSLSGTLLAAAIVCISLAILAPVFGLMVALFGAGLALVAALAPANGMVMFSIIPAHMRPHMAALSGIATAAVGGTAGLLLLSGVDRRFGTGGAILSLAIPGVAGGLILRSAAKFVNADLDRMLGEIIEEEELDGLARAGTRLPMLACRHIDFAYGQLQVLFDVNFTVDDSEIVALLGTNGAGKSTLLKVVSGIGLPLRGSVRFRGQDITYLDAERRLRLGITQIPGGRAVFGPLSVADNLRAYAFTLGTNRRRVDEAIGRSLEAFPRLGERQGQKAMTLSGGEQQMLALAKALILEPRLLLIDELSLGLAPVIVEQLLDMVRQINAQGTAVVLVEQSVNIALELVEHAYFMEKGEIRFDGASDALLARDDLLRAVFLDGVGPRSEA